MAAYVRATRRGKSKVGRPYVTTKEIEECQAAGGPNIVTPAAYNRWFAEKRGVTRHQNIKQVHIRP